MKVLKICVLASLAFFSCNPVFGQQPFEDYGYKVKVGTLSNGKYQEFFDQDTLVEVGSVVINTNTGKVVYFVTHDTTYSEATLEPDVISRWTSPDPLSHKYFSYSPYNFVLNNPLRYKDPDGREVVGVTKDKEGNLVYSKQAQKNGTQTLITAMMKTKTGAAAVGQMMESKTKISIEVKAGKSPDGQGYGETKGSGKNKDGTYATAKITVYSGEHDKDVKEGTGKYSTASKEEYYNSVGTHESVHTEADQIKKDEAFDGKTDTEEQYKNYMENVEGAPHAREVKSRLEYNKQYGGSDAWKEVYRKNYVPVPEDN